MTSSTPNPTLYIKNIDWKIKKNLLRRALYSLFTRHGKVIDIITSRKDNLRGQAFVIMEDINAATAALNAEQGFTFFGKDMVIEYAHMKSDIIAKRDGDYIPKAQRQKRKILTDSNNNNNNNNEMDVPSNAESTNVVDVTSKDDTNDVVVVKSEKEPTVETNTESTNNTMIQQLQPQESVTPTHILVAQNLPKACNEMMLHILFQQHTGYKTVRMITDTTTTITTGVVEFENDTTATTAYNALNGFQLSPQEKLNLTYGKVE
jgi:U2 small nuclear ribonucleoprotein B''